jgi:hypothetical protein
MLTEKCPFCGSYNDVDAAVCYFCHKDLPDTPGHKKKRQPKQEAKKSISLPPSMAGLKKKSPPGCLIIFCTFFLFACAVLVFQILNNNYHFLQYEIPIPANQAGSFIGYYLQGLIGYINSLWEYPAIAVCSIVMIIILCYGLLNLRKWSRVLAMMLFSILLVASFALFGYTVIHYDRTSVGNINFILSLLGVGLNIYCLVWFFEHKKLFE